LQADQPTLLYGDNQGSLALAENPEFHQRTKHIEVQWHYIKEQVEQAKIRLSFLPTAQMAADGLTKALTTSKFQSFLKLINLVALEL
jgi:RAB protein geranylgeranyltransferase component A